MRAFLSIFCAQFRTFVRNPVDFFLTLLLPLALIVLFGFIWGQGERPIRVGVFFTGAEELFLSVVAEFPVVSYRTYTDEKRLEEAVARREADLGLVWDGTKVLVFLDRSRIQENPDFEALARRITRALELRQAGVSPPVRPMKIHVGKLSAPNWYHYIVPGLMVVAILQAGVFAVAGRLAGMRERGILRRMLVTPLSGWAVLSGIGLLRMIVGFAAAGLNFFVAQAIFGVAFSVNAGLLLFYALACGLGGMGLGAVVTVLARRPGSAATLGSILVQMMLFLSGIYIPFEFLPPGLQVLGQILPAYHLAQGMRAALGVVEPSLLSFLASLGFTLFGLATFLIFSSVALRPE